MIKKVGKKYTLFSKKTKKKLGTFDTLKEAKKREREIQFFKNKGGKK